MAYFLLNGVTALLLIGITPTYSDNVVLCFLRNPPNRGLYGDTDIFMTSDVDGASVTVYDSINDVNQTILLGQKYERFSLRLNSSISRLDLNRIENKSIMITSVDDIYVLVFSNVYGTSTDVFTPRPVSHLGLMYVVLTNCQLSVAHCEIGIASVLEPTNIAVYIPANFTGSINFNGTTYQACDVIEVVLQPLQTVQFAAKADLTGLLISSDREVAAFTGADKTMLFPEKARDHLSASSPPLMHWGNLYIVVRDSTAQHSDVIKVVSSKDDTYVLLTECGSTTLLFLMHAFQDHLNHSFNCEFVKISAENNILVSHFVVRTQWQNAGMYYPVPLQYYTSNYVVPVAPFYKNCQLSLVARDGEQNNILVQDTVISAQWTSVTASPYIVTTVTVSNTEVVRVTDFSGATFGGHLTCFSLYTTAATVLLPKDINLAASSGYGTIPPPERIPGILKCEDTTSTPEITARDVTSTPETTASDVTTTPETTVSDVISTPETTARDVTSSSETTIRDVISTPETIARDVTSTPKTTVRDVNSTPETTARDVTSTPETTAPDVTSTPETTVSDAISTPETTARDVTSTPETTARDVTSTSETTASDVTSTPEITVIDVISTPETTDRDVTSTPETTVSDVISTPETTARDVTSTSKTTVRDVTSTPVTTARDVTSTPETTAPDVTSTPVTTARDVTSTSETTVRDVTSTPVTTARDVTSTPVTTARDVTSTPITDPVVTTMCPYTSTLILCACFTRKDAGERVPPDVFYKSIQNISNQR